MNRSYIFFLFLLIVSCEDRTNKRTGICGDGNNICFEVNGQPAALDARWFEHMGSYRIYAEEFDSGDSACILVHLGYHSPKLINVYFDNSWIPPEVAVVYGLDTLEYYADYGSMSITNVYESKVTGEFEAIFHESTDTFIISHGHFDAIPYE